MVNDDAQKKFWEARQKVLGSKGKPSAAKPGGSSARSSGRSSTKHATASKKVVRKYIGSALIVEPDKRQRMLLENEMKRCGFDPIGAADGQEALSAASAEMPLIMIVEKELPDMPGFSCCSRLRALSGAAEVPIILTANSQDPTLRDQAVMVGANAFIPKPINLGKLQTLGKAIADKARKNLPLIDEEMEEESS